MDVQNEFGKVTVTTLKGDPEWPFYWHAYIGDLRVNGGVCINRQQGYSRGRIAIADYRRHDFIERYIWDEEAYTWYDRETGEPTARKGSWDRRIL